MPSSHRVERACWEGPNWGRIDLTADWNDMMLPPIKLPEGVQGRLLLTRESSLEYAKMSGYAINGGWVSFVSPIYSPGEKLYVAGDFNGWGKAIGQKAWEMSPSNEIEGGSWALLTVQRELIGDGKYFKFVNKNGVWHEPPHNAVNVGINNGARNHMISPHLTGAHLFHFEIAGDPNWGTINEFVWQGADHFEKIPLWPGRSFYQMQSSSPQGTAIEGNKTRFRLFCPRATKVQVTYFREGSPEIKAPMSAEADGCWSTLINLNLEGASYFYTIEGPVWPHTAFDVNRRVMDPWALAVRDGLGVVVDLQKLKKTAPVALKETIGEMPAYEDLIICEAHVRDLVAKAPIPLTEAERMGFSGVTKLLEWPENPFTSMGINAVEIQPLMEFDGDGKAYHWGYMPTNYFAPASAYGSDRAHTTQLTEVQKMVEAFHKKGIAVILDVVFNHMGVPASPMNIDKAYYFRMNSDGGLTNWSGCGNDFRVESAMAERMALESLEHWATVYGIDGFRFDLGELLGVSFLKKVEEKLRAVKPGIILIAEPWSFRGHIAGALKDTNYISWNDGFREFVPAYLNGMGDAEGLKMFVGGSVGGVAARPTQSLNYVESHDDYGWMDKITQNLAHNGYYPTLADRRKTHLMASLMTMSLGVPMWACGMEALRSKYGVANTYLRGDINAIDYSRVREFPGTAEYFRGLNMFRRGPHGKAIRISERAENYLKFFTVERCSAMGVLYNAAEEEACKRVLYVINPLPTAVRLSLPGLDVNKWRQVADHERINEQGLALARFEWTSQTMEVPPMSCGVFVES